MSICDKMSSTEINIKKQGTARSAIEKMIISKQI